MQQTRPFEGMHAVLAEDEVKPLAKVGPAELALLLLKVAGADDANEIAARTQRSQHRDDLVGRVGWN